jgi:hypothetical protein
MLEGAIAHQRTLEGNNKPLQLKKAELQNEWNSRKIYEGDTVMI